MKPIKKISENEVWYEWLKSEYKDRLPPKYHPQCEKLLTDPNLQDKKQNQRRKQLLYKIRWHLLERIPPNTTWYTVELAEKDIKNLYLLGFWTWNILSENTRKLETITKNLLNNNSFIPDEIINRIDTNRFDRHRKKVKGILSKKQILKDFKPILLGKTLSKDPTLIEGCHRASALYISCFITKEMEYTPIQAFCGIVGKEKCIVLAPESSNSIMARNAQMFFYRDVRGVAIAKQLVKSKLHNINQFLAGRNLPVIESQVFDEIEEVQSKVPEKARKELLIIDEKFTKYYLDHVYELVPERFRPGSSEGLRVFDGRNNPFEFAYRTLHTHAFTAIMTAELEPYLGFLYPPKSGRSYSFTLTGDFCELFRYQTDNVLIDYLVEHVGLVSSEISDLVDSEVRNYLGDDDFYSFNDKLIEFFGNRDKVSSGSQVNRSNLGGILGSDVYRLAEYLREEKESWTPRSYPFFNLI